tara:strand:+ start:43 stop:228 length:186 start_codon:yes stop_codon:yes gene_type:complete
MGKAKIISTNLIVLVFISCDKDKTLLPRPCGATISYTPDNIPIIQSSFITPLGEGTGCHDL